MISENLFEQFYFSDAVMDGIHAIGYTTPTPIQLAAIPAILAGNDLLASAQTGTGKTAAFLLPLIHILSQTPRDSHVKALIIVPTRELALQIDQQMEGFSYFTNLSSIAIYGGTDGITFDREKQALVSGSDVIVCTPGRMIAHLNMGYVKFPHLKYLILDEADRMMDMGFFEDISKILKHLPENRQNLMFSATMPVKIRQLAHQILKKPVEINIATSQPADNIIQKVFFAYDTQKTALIAHLLKEKEYDKVLIFCSTKEKAHELAHKLNGIGIKAAEIHSTLDQTERELVMNKFRAGLAPVLVATNIVSRGIDIDDIDLVINYDVPRDGEDYIHRVGRTARAAAMGLAITLVNQNDFLRLQNIEQLIGNEIPKVNIPPSLGEQLIYQPCVPKSNKRFHKGKRKSTKNRNNHKK